MVSMMTIKPQLPDHWLEIREVCEIFIKVVSNGSTMGKLRMAISEKLLLAREAMAAIIVRTDANPKLPSSKAVRNKGILMTMFPIRSKKNTKDKTERMDISKRLYNTFARRIACGLAMV